MTGGFQQDALRAHASGPTGLDVSWLTPGGPRSIDVTRRLTARSHVALRLSVLAAVALLGLLALWSSGVRALSRPSGPQLYVAAAADLRPALTDMARVYEARTGTKVVLTFGSTGQLTQQIENGAPFDVFLAADEGYIERLHRGGHTLAGTEQRYARGRLALVTAQQAERRLDRLADLSRVSVRHIAIANPDHAPYGLAARQALEAAGLWEALSGKLVYGENVQQAMQYVKTGQADAGLVALALAQSSGLRWALVPEELHRPLHQALAVVWSTRQENEARRFADLVLSPDGQTILQEYGFEPPGRER